MTNPPAPAPGYRIERCANLFVYIKQPWWHPHQRTCDVFRAPHADCDCGADITW